jgi:hypothetical protein
MSAKRTSFDSAVVIAKSSNAPSITLPKDSRYVSSEARAALAEGLADARRMLAEGVEPIDRGSFAQYADDDLDDE